MEPEEVMQDPGEAHELVSRCAGAIVGAKQLEAGLARLSPALTGGAAENLDTGREHLVSVSRYLMKSMIDQEQMSRKALTKPGETFPGTLVTP